MRKIMMQTLFCGADGCQNMIQSEVDVQTGEPMPPSDPFTEMRLAVAELAEVAMTRDIENKKAIAELAEAVMGGTK